MCAQWQLVTVLFQSVFTGVTAHRFTGKVPSLRNGQLEWKMAEVDEHLPSDKLG